MYISVVYIYLSCRNFQYSSVWEVFLFKYHSIANHIIKHLKLQFLIAYKSYSIALKSHSILLKLHSIAKHKIVKNIHEMAVLSDCTIDMIYYQKTYIVQQHDYWFQIVHVSPQVRTYPVRPPHLLIMEYIQEAKAFSGLSQKVIGGDVNTNVKTSTCAEIICFLIVCAI